MISKECIQQMLFSFDDLYDLYETLHAQERLYLCEYILENMAFEDDIDERMHQRCCDFSEVLFKKHPRYKERCEGNNRYREAVGSFVKYKKKLKFSVRIPGNNEMFSYKESCIGDSTKSNKVIREMRNYSTRNYRGGCVCNHCGYDPRENGKWGSKYGGHGINIHHHGIMYKEIFDRFFKKYDFDLDKIVLYSGCYDEYSRKFVDTWIEFHDSLATLIPLCKECHKKEHNRLKKQQHIKNYYAKKEIYHAVHEQGC